MVLREDGIEDVEQMQPNSACDHTTFLCITLCMEGWVWVHWGASLCAEHPPLKQSSTKHALSPGH